MTPAPTQAPRTGAAAAPDLSAASAAFTQAVFRKINWRLMPLLLICYAVAYLDRINIGYAQLQMRQTLDFSDAVYGLGAGIFFIGYLLFEVPSNLMLEKIGARKTLLRIMLCWGLVAAAMRLQGEWSARNEPASCTISLRRSLYGASGLARSAMGARTAQPRIRASSRATSSATVPDGPAPAVYKREGSTSGT